MGGRVDGGGERGLSSLRCSWTAACGFASVFTLLSVEFGDDSRLVIAGGAGLVAVAGLGLRRAQIRCVVAWVACCMRKAQRGVCARSGSLSDFST